MKIYEQGLCYNSGVWRKFTGTPHCGMNCSVHAPLRKPFVANASLITFISGVLVEILPLPCTLKEKVIVYEKYFLIKVIANNFL